MKRSLLWIVLVGVLLMLAACGDDTSDSGGSGGDSAPAATEVPPTPAGDAAHGEELYSQTCVACHGPGGEGVEGLGKPFTTSEFIGSSSDADLLAFIKVGRPVGDSANTTGVDMPPKGGNPAFSDEDITDIIAYMRSLQ